MNVTAIKADRQGSAYTFFFFEVSQMNERDMKIGPLTGAREMVHGVFRQMQSDLQNVHKTRISCYDSGLRYLPVQTSMPRWDVTIAGS